MLESRFTFTALIAAVCLASLSLLAATTALAAPITVNLRVEGSTQTLFEGPVVTEGSSFSTASSNGVHPCDYADNGNSGGEFSNGGSPAGTPTTALRDAALANGLAFDAEWFGSGKEGNENPGDFFVTQVGSDMNENSGSFASWGYAVNFLTAPVGGCQIALAPGSEVLWAYNYFNLEHRLSLSGPPSAASGAPFTVHVVDGGTGVPQAGAAIGEVIGGVSTTIPGSATTDSAGNATIALAHTGTVTLKASAEGAVRSNGLPICVHNGDDGTCSTTLPGVGIKPAPPIIKPAVAEIAGIAAGHVYSSRGAPRLLHGIVHVSEGSALKDVRISLQRSVGKRCFVFSGSRGRFLRAHCGQKNFFSVGDSLSFSYLLPARLPAGRYVYDIATVPAAAQTAASHVVFRVR
jgi:hypothetical protein